MIIWDVDGVLIWHDPTDPAKDWRRELIALDALDIWEEFQGSPFWRECLVDPDRSVRDALGKFSKDQNSDLIDNILKIWLERNIEPNQPAIDCLKALQLLQCPCAIGTNQDGLRAPVVTRWLKEHNINLKAFISCEIGHAKPSGEFFQAVEDELRISYKDLLLLDDNLENVASAQKRGWAALHVTPDFDWKDFYERVQ